MVHSYILSPFNIVQCLNTKCGRNRGDDLFFLFFLFALLKYKTSDADTPLQTYNSPEWRRQVEL